MNKIALRVGRVGKSGPRVILKNTGMEVWGQNSLQDFPSIVGEEVGKLEEGGDMKAKRGDS